MTQTLIFFVELTVIDEGDEVVLFDPAYETYGTCISLAGGVPVSYLVQSFLASSLKFLLVGFELKNGMKF